MASSNDLPLLSPLVSLLALVGGEWRGRLSENGSRSMSEDGVVMRCVMVTLLADHSLKSMEAMVLAVTAR